MKQNWFLKFFPTPRFLEMPSVGLDISDGVIRIIELINTSKGKRLGRYGKVILPKDIMFKGEVKNKEKLAQKLKEIKEEFNFDFARISITEKKSYIFRTQILKTEKMKLDEVYGSLNFKLEENVPLKLNSLVFDFDILRNDPKKLDVVVSVLPKDEVVEFMDVFDKSGVTPLSLEVEAHAISRSSVPYGDMGTFMVVDFGATRVSISIVSEGIVQLTSTFDVGGDDITNVIKKYLNISEKEADKIKKEKGITKIDSNDELFFAMMTTIAAIKDEMNKYLIYWHGHKDNTKNKKVKNKIQKIILCGESGSLKGLDDYLSLSLGLNAEKVNIWQNIFDLNDFIPEISFSDSLEYAAAVGLAMRTGDKILLSNRLPNPNKK